jgi:hypothetical protein
MDGPGAAQHSPPPCDIGSIDAALAATDDEPRRGYHAAALLQQRMQRCGVSRWHPDLLAIAKAERANSQPAR